MGNDFFEQLKNELADYGKSVGEVGRLRLIGLVSRLLGLFLLIFTVVLCALALFTFSAVAVINALSAYLPVWGASLIIGSTYIVLIIIAIAYRKPLFVHPFIKLLSKEIRTEEELALKIRDAEHRVEEQNIRIEYHVKDTTRELNFCMNLFSRLRNLIRGKKRK